MDNRETKNNCELQQEERADRAKEMWLAIISFPFLIPFRIVDKIMFNLECVKKERCLTTISSKRTEDDFIPQFEDTDVCAFPCSHSSVKVTGYILGVRVGYEEAEIFVDADRYRKMSVGDIVQIDYRWGLLGPRAAII